MILPNKYISVLFSAVLVGLSQHYSYLGFFSWFGLVPLLGIIFKENNFFNLIKYSLIWGLVYHLIVVFWLANNIGTTPFIAFLIMVITVLILSLNTVLIVLIWNPIRRFIPNLSFIFFPIIWVTVEFIRSYGLLGFPWVSLANSQTEYLYLIQNAEYVGIYGISFWIISLNIFLHRIIFRKQDFKNIIFLIILILPWFSGFIIINKYDKKSFKSKEVLETLIMQPNIGLVDKRDFDKNQSSMKNLIDSTLKNISTSTKLVIWPESAMPYQSIQNRGVRNFLNDNLFIENLNLLTGNIIYNETDYFNSSVLINKNGILGTYNKRQLVPLAEYFPFSSTFKSLRNINIGQANFSKGDKDYVFELDGYRFASLICIESTFPEINRRHANLGIDALIFLVNDGWYLNNPEPMQHARQSIFRAIENRLPVIRCANTGISQIVNPLGIIENKIDLNNFGTIRHGIIKNNNEKTFYTKHGNVFSLVLLVITLIVLFLSIVNYKKNE
tara:strand:- start:681 stop:2177 length:1497 start_codon:yes stop_codon:yes gene_type:complete